MHLNEPGFAERAVKELEALIHEKGIPLKEMNR